MPTRWHQLSRLRREAVGTQRKDLAKSLHKERGGGDADTSDRLKC